MVISSLCLVLSPFVDLMQVLCVFYLSSVTFKQILTVTSVQGQSVCMSGRVCGYLSLFAVVLSLFESFFVSL